MREATITPHLMKTRMKRSGQSEPTCNSLLPIKMTKTENLLNIIMRFLTSLSQSIIPTAHRDTEIENPCRQKAHATEKERDGIIEGWRKTLVAHGNRREKSIWCLWMLVEDAVLVPFGRGGDLLILLAEEALTDFSQV